MSRPADGYRRIQLTSLADELDAITHIATRGHFRWVVDGTHPAGYWVPTEPEGVESLDDLDDESRHCTWCGDEVRDLAKVVGKAAYHPACADKAVAARNAARLATYRRQGA